MRYLLLITFLVLIGGTHAQSFERDGEGWHRRTRVLCHCWRDHERDEGWQERRAHRNYEREEDRDSWWRRARLEQQRTYRRRERYQAWSHHEREEGYSEGWKRREHEDGYRGWKHPERNEVYRGWWSPEGGWREAELRDGARRCRPPMHAAGDADARSEAARNHAIKAWQEQVINEHGERFLNFDAAYVLDEHCDPARVGEGNIIELKRCVVTAAPCLTPRELDRENRGREEERRQ